MFLSASVPSHPLTQSITPLTQAFVIPMIRTVTTIILMIVAMTSQNVKRMCFTRVISSSAVHSRCGAQWDSTSSLSSAMRSEALALIMGCRLPWFQYSVDEWVQWLATLPPEGYGGYDLAAWTSWVNDMQERWRLEWFQYHLDEWVDWVEALPVEGYGGYDQIGWATWVGNMQERWPRAPLRPTAGPEWASSGKQWQWSP